MGWCHFKYVIISERKACSVSMLTTYCRFALQFSKGHNYWPQTASVNGSLYAQQLTEASVLCTFGEFLYSGSCDDALTTFTIIMLCAFENVSMCSRAATLGSDLVSRTSAFINSCIQRQVLSASFGNVF